MTPTSDLGGTTGRRLRLELPAGLRLLNANKRLHWRAKARDAAAIRHAAAWAATRARLPCLGRVRIVAELQFPDPGRRRDPANWAPSAKPAVDGLVDAGVLEDDDHSHLDGPDMRIGGHHPQARMVLHITELGLLTHPERGR